MIFFDLSTRTRNAFEAGMTQLGGHAHYVDAATSPGCMRDAELGNFRTEQRQHGMRVVTAVLVDREELDLIERSVDALEPIVIEPCLR